MAPTIKDPTFDVYKDGGNVERRGKEIKKDDLKQLQAKDDVDLIFDIESGISDRIVRDFYKERKPGQSITDWMDTKPREYFLNLPLELKDGGNVILLSDYLKQKRKPPIKKINLDSAAPGRTLDSLTEAEREVVNKLLRMSLGKED
jgi:hypothetical protein|tara:strand:- start:23 stop:460 length:438 start_codon:yes stop_codon:yes gene_type:complete